MRKYLLLMIGLFIIVSSCSEDNDNNQQIDQKKTIEEGISINNDPADLSSRVSTMNKLVQINNLPTGTKSGNEGIEIDYTKNYAFKLKAEVEAPKVKGKAVQATHVKIIDDMAFVSYNTKGIEYSGGVDLFDISDEDNPILQAQVLLSDIDVSAVDYYDGVIYLVGALDEKSEGYTLESPAILLALELSNSKKIISTTALVDLPSYVGTDVEIDENYIYATSGSDGKLTILKRSDYSLVKDIDINDARSLSSNADNIYTLSAPQQIRTFTKTDFTPLTDIQVTGSVTIDSKTEIDVTDEYILAALNVSGLDIRNLDGSLKEHFNRPATPTNGLDENYVTNSVCLNEELLLIGNGGAGVYVGAMIPENENNVSLLGSMDFGTSVNFVESRGNYIFVAAGTGGLKILTIELDEGEPEIVIPTKPCETLVDNIIEMFPERKDNRSANDDLFSDDNKLILKLIKESPVYLTFIEENAGYKNSLAYYTYDAENPPASADEIELHMLFPNASKEESGGGLKAGDRVQLGDAPFAQNTVIGFCLIVNGWKNGATVEGIYRHYTNIAWNNGEQQHVMFKEKNCLDIVLCFEDVQLPSGDKDFNDIIFTVNDNEDDANVATAFDLTNIVEK
ncbi:DUF4114 domain-containing protein [Labilibaculum antarcticum]|uniref:DUF4114 domain-containing protein n=1 Tax=Labilibaculum antarcticum TaxID=1717717 RepID=A0A1Y1CIH4_9BACT|nr:DUF4114 domain-containing protein [Labilibaculum antarcticum]BAX79822.1 hypothetical protein ALGA_1441 [Labilibaculum antarcticum]